jgi:FkbM family methyltransferase
MIAEAPVPWMPAPGAPIAVTQTRHGVMAYNPRDAYIGRSIERYGEFGELELDVMRAVTPAGGVVFDVGANIGTHSVALARHVGPTGKVFAFEPQRIVHGMLVTNATLNALTWIHPVHALVGAQPGHQLVADYDYTQAANYGAISLAQQAERGWPVAVTTLDEYCWVPRCDLVKIDVEGMEAQVLDGGRAFVARFRPMLFVENDRESTSRGVLERLLAADYRVYWHVARMYNPANWRGDRENVFDVLGAVNLLCIARERAQNIVGMHEVTDPDRPPPYPLAPF